VGVALFPASWPELKTAEHAVMKAMIVTIFILMTRGWDGFQINDPVAFIA
jgi:hypothetical protein